MDTSPAAVTKLIDQGIASTRARRYGEAGQQFLDAFDIVDAWPDGPRRWKQLGRLADICFEAGHPDLALMALQDALESDLPTRDPGRHCADLLTLANSWQRLGRPDASEATNNAALAYALQHQRFADAASASTNIAMLAANSGRLAEALDRLRTSLEYLARDANPDTDAITRLSLIQVVDAMHAAPSIALDASADLFTRLVQYVGPERWQAVAPAFHRLVERYVAEHRDLDADAWKRQTFPLVFGEAT